MIYITVTADKPGEGKTGVARFISDLLLQNGVTVQVSYAEPQILPLDNKVIPSIARRGTVVKVKEVHGTPVWASGNFGEEL